MCLPYQHRYPAWSTGNSISIAISIAISVAISVVISVAISVAISIAILILIATNILSTRRLVRLVRSGGLGLASLPVLEALNFQYRCRYQCLQVYGFVSIFTQF